MSSFSVENIRERSIDGEKNTKTLLINLMGLHQILITVALEATSENK